MAGNETTVLIVGAGPTGMVLALQLIRYGVSVRLIEKKQIRSMGSKALSINPLTLHILNDLDVADSIVAQGHKTQRLNVVFENKRLVGIDFSKLAQRYPYFIMLPQPETEKVLERKLETCGCRVEYGNALTRVTLSDEAVTAETTCATGRYEVRKYDYVVGCDGARSTVRAGLGFQFTGHDYGMHFILADVRIDWPGSHDEVFYFINSTAFFILVPLPRGYHRVVVKVDGPIHAQEEKPRLDDIQRIIRTCGIQDLLIRDPIWISRAPFYNRIATSNQLDRIFLAGDAFHLFSPIGGFGMNTGIGDAFNLGWKLGYVINGWADVNLLTSYPAERMLVAQRLLEITDKSTSLMARLNRHSAADEAQYLPRMANRKVLRRLIYTSSGMAQTYQPIQPVDAGVQVLAGCILPFIDDLIRMNKEMVVGHGKHMLVYFESTDRSQANQLVAKFSAIARQHASRLAVMVIAPTAENVLWNNIGYIQDDGNRLREKHRLSPNAAILVRPDFYVERISSANRDHKELIEYFLKRYAAHELVHAAQIPNPGRQSYSLFQAIQGFEK